MFSETVRTRAEILKVVRLYCNNDLAKKRRTSKIKCGYTDLLI